jgi:hypothetical protein
MSVKILKSKISVLLISENPDYEISFLKRFLEQSNRFETELRLIGDKSGNLKKSLPVNQIEFNRYDLIILHDLDLNKLSSRIDIIKSYLHDRGGALWVIMGQTIGQQLIPQGFREILPFYPIKSNVLYRNFTGEPVKENIYHPSIQLGQTQKDILENWSELPPFELLVLSDYINPNATVLATTSILNRTDIPIIGFNQLGAGKLFATGALPFWTWGFVNLGYDEDDNYYRNFINETVLWLTISDDFDPIRISTDKDVYHRLEPINFTGYVYDIGYRPLSGVSGIIKIINSNNDNTIEKDLKNDNNGKFRTKFTNLSAGQYDYYTIFTKDNLLVKELTGKFTVEPYSIEEFNSDGNSELLRYIATMTGGKYYRYENFDQIVTDVDTNKISKTENKELTLSNRFVFLLIFLVAISIEWLLRRFYQLI